jgi:hypothetical protein
MFVAHLLFSISSSLIIRVVPYNYVASARSSPLRFNISTLMIRAHLQYITILHGKESHDE